MAAEPDDQPDTKNRLGPVRRLPATIGVCYECGVYFDPKNVDAEFCAQCGEELWELEKA